MEKTNRFLQKVPVYLMLHGSFDRDLVLWRAQSKIGEEKYNLVTNNCEHFAMWCITGRSSCDQINKGLEMVYEGVGQRLVSKAATRAEAKIAACSASHTGRAIMRAEVGRQLVSKGAGMKGKLAIQSVSHTGRLIMRTRMTQSMAPNGLTTMASVAGTAVGGILAGGALAGAFEGLSMACDIGKRKNRPKRIRQNCGEESCDWRQPCSRVHHWNGRRTSSHSFSSCGSCYRRCSRCTCGTISWKSYRKCSFMTTTLKMMLVIMKPKTLKKSAKRILVVMVIVLIIILIITITILSNLIGYQLP